MSPAPLFTPQEEEQLKQKLLEEGQWKYIDAAIDRIQTRLAETKGSAQATRGHARKLWESARASREVQYVNTQVPRIVFPGSEIADPDPRYDYMCRMDDLEGWLDRQGLQALPPATPLEQKKRRTRYQQDRVKRALKALPDLTNLPNGKFCEQISNWLKAESRDQNIPWVGISNNSILRAAGRKKK